MSMINSNSRDNFNNKPNKNKSIKSFLFLGYTTPITVSLLCYLFFTSNPPQ